MNEQAIEILNQALELDPESEEIKKEIDFLTNELLEDNHVPVLEEKVKIDALRKKMEDDGAKFTKMKMRYYAPNYRGVHASRDVLAGETILFVPHKQLLSIKVAQESPICKLMTEKELKTKLKASKDCYFATYIMEERRKDKSIFSEYFDVLPTTFNEFPYYFTAEEIAWLDGSPGQALVHEKI